MRSRNKSMLTLKKTKKHFYLEMVEEIELNSACQEDCANMIKYIRQLEKDQFCQVRGTAIPKLKSTQAENKKLKELKSRAQKALHFSRLFGLEVDCLKLKDQDSSKTYTVEFNNASVRSEVSDKSDVLCFALHKSFYIRKCYQKGAESSTEEKVFFFFLLLFPSSPLRVKQTKERSS